MTGLGRSAASIVALVAPPAPTELFRGLPALMDGWMDGCEWIKQASKQASVILYKASRFLPHFRKETKSHQLALLHHNEIGSLRARRA
jgi:hypothetical protein